MQQTQVRAVLFEGNRSPEKKVVIAGQWRKCRKDSASLTGDCWMLWFECLFSPQIHMLNSNAQCDGNTSWGIWEVIR